MPALTLVESRRGRAAELVASVALMIRLKALSAIVLDRQKHRQVCGRRYVNANASHQTLGQLLFKKICGQPGEAGRS
jgi:hypothetical protein